MRKNKIKCNDKKLRKFAKFCLNYFNVTQVELVIKFKKSKDLEDAAEVHDLGNHRYKIVLFPDNIKGTNLEICIAHEITHIKQHEQNGLDIYFKKTKTRFNGKIWDINLDNASEYFFAPWEVEARMMEEPLVFFYAQAKK